MPSQHKSTRETSLQSTLSGRTWFRFHLLIWMIIHHFCGKQEEEVRRLPPLGVPRSTRPLPIDPPEPQLHRLWALNSVLIHGNATHPQITSKSEKNRTRIVPWGGFSWGASDRGTGEWSFFEEEDFTVFCGRLVRSYEGLRNFKRWSRLHGGYGRHVCESQQETEPSCTLWWGSSTFVREVLWDFLVGEWSMRCLKSMFKRE